MSTLIDEAVARRIKESREEQFQESCKTWWEGYISALADVGAISESSFETFLAALSNEDELSTD